MGRDLPVIVWVAGLSTQLGSLGPSALWNTIRAKIKVSAGLFPSEAVRDSLLHAAVLASGGLFFMGYRSIISMLSSSHGIFHVSVSVINVPFLSGF
jgi:hypothetical protein